MTIQSLPPFMAARPEEYHPQVSFYNDPVTGGRAATIRATGGDDRVFIRQQGDMITAFINRDIVRLSANDLAFLKIKGGAGNDSIIVDDSVTVPVRIEGGSGNDMLKGGSGPNFISGGYGDDTLIGGNGFNILSGGYGNDTLIGRLGRDIMSGGPGFDRYIDANSGYSISKLPQTFKDSADVYQRPVITTPAPRPVILPAPKPMPKPAPKIVPQKTPKPPPKPPLSQLNAAIDTYDKKGFRAGRSMAKSMAAAFYEGPARFESYLKSIAGQKERDDAAASFLRAVVENDPNAKAHLNDLSPTAKKLMSQYISGGNAWSSEKHGMAMVAARIAGDDAGFKSRYSISGNDSREAYNYFARKIGL